MPKKRGRKQIGDFIENGNIVRQGLEDLEKDEKWLIELLKKQTKAEPKDFFCAEWVETNYGHIRSLPANVQNLLRNLTV